ncbi:DUF998 domain-containing protein [Kitasatospora sp. McL0602]|uniref:DUF998 domain-containing protein n=1 Tax=Kitasatospora sp. McL0602 TaxID=3439530 RepID=UPI003F8BF326
MSNGEQLRSPRRALAVGAVVAQVLFTGSWLVGDLVQGTGHSISAGTISELGALTAAHPWPVLATQAVAGVLTIAFALLALAPTLNVTGGRPSAGAWFVAASPWGLDPVEGIFFRLDCRVADPGCPTNPFAGSWHAAAHAVTGLAGFVIMVITPPLLAVRFRANPAWKSWSGAALGTSPLFFFGFLAFAGLSGHNGVGYAERALALLGSAGVVLLALKTYRLSSPTRHDLLAEPEASDTLPQARAR